MLGVERRPAVAAGAVGDGEVELVVAGPSSTNRSKTSSRTSAARWSGRSTLLIITRARRPALEGLAQDEARLRHRALVGVDEQQDRVRHGERALDLAAEVGVAGGVDDVDARAAVLDGRVLGQDRDPALALLGIRVEHPLLDPLVRAEGTGEGEHRVDEGGLAVVDVGDDGEIAYLLVSSHGDG